MTSLAFMFDDVPEPVWKTSIGNWLSWAPEATSSAAFAIAFARFGSSRPSSPLARAAAPLMRPSQCTTSAGTGSPEIGKLLDGLGGLAAVEALAGHVIAAPGVVGGRC